MLEPIKGYELKALKFAEHHGIIDYEVEGNEMIWQDTYYEPEKVTYQSNLNLDTMKENRKEVK